MIWNSPNNVSAVHWGKARGPDFCIKSLAPFHPSFDWNPILSTGHVAGNANHNAECEVAGPFQAQLPENGIFGCGQFFTLTQHVVVVGVGWGCSGVHVLQAGPSVLMLWEVCSGPFISPSCFSFFDLSYLKRVANFPTFQESAIQPPPLQMKTKRNHKCRINFSLPGSFAEYLVIGSQTNLWRS